MCCIQVAGPEENILRGLDHLTSTETGKNALHLKTLIGANIS